VIAAHLRGSVTREDGLRRGNTGLFVDRAFRFKLSEARGTTAQLARFQDWRFDGAGDAGASFKDPASGIIAFVDGDLYDTQVAASRLGVRAGMSNAELVVRGYQSMGVEVASLLDGDFAVVIWDPGAGRLLALRDPIGLRPLYFHQNGQDVYLASEPEQIVFGLGMRFSPNAVKIWDWLTNRWQTDQTFLSKIVQVRPGHALVASDGRCEQRRYFFPEFDPNIARASLADVTAMLADTVTRETALRLKASSSSLIHLSGGLDSGFLAFAAREAVAQYGVDPAAVILGSCRFYGEPHDEGEAIQRAVARLPFAHEEWDGRCVDAEEFDSPILSAPARRHPMNSGPGDVEVVKRRGVQGVLAGFGGDEVFGDAEARLEALARGHLVTWLRSFKQNTLPMVRGRLAAHRNAWSCLFTDAVVLRVGALRRRRAAASWPLHPSFDPNSLPDEASARFDGSADLARPGLSRAIWRRLVGVRFWHRITDFARMWDAVGVRLRLPLLSRSVIRIVLSATPEERIPIGKLRRLQRLALGSLATPAISRSRSKMFFNAEVSRFLRNNGRSVEGLLAPGSTWFSGEYVDRDLLRREFDTLTQGSPTDDFGAVSRWRAVRSSLLLEAWLRAGSVVDSR